MKEFIKILLREGLDESINLNLSKQIRSKQLDVDINKTLEDIFGKNIYRLYYDVNTGKQIQPTRKEPKLKFDVEVVDNLKADIDTILSKLGYSLVDLDKNIAKSNKNGQTIKATKVLQSSDKLIFKKYTEYLSSITNATIESEKLYVVVSRHSHDIASMSSKPNIESCETLSDYTDIKQTLIGKDVDGVEGYGVHIWDNIQSDGIVFYLIKEGDWNIQDPISRFLGAGICEFGNSYHFYGKFHNKFKNFVIGWVEYYKSKVLNQYTVKSDKDFFNKSVDELVKILNKSINNNDNNKEYIIRGLVKNDRYDVLYDLMTKTDYKFDDEGRPKHTKVFDSGKVKFLVDILSDIFGYKIIEKFPNNIKKPIVDYVTSLLDDNISKLKEINEYFRNPENVKDLYIKHYSRFLKDGNLSKVFLDLLKSKLLTMSDTNFTEIGDIGEWADPDKLNEYKRELIFYKKNGGYDKLQSTKKDIYNSIIDYFEQNKKG